MVTQPHRGLAELQVGDSRWLVRDVHRQPDETVTISVRAGDVIVALDVPPKISARNVIGAVIDDLHVLDDQVLVYADIGVRVVVEITLSALEDLGLQKGQEVYLIIKTNSILVLDRPERSSA